MNDKELNEKIAVKRGWQFSPVGGVKPDGSIYHYYDPENRLRPCPPDYCNSWQWAGGLLEDLPKGYRVWQTRKGWICAKINAKWIQANSLTRAIAEAWDSVNP